MMVVRQLVGEWRCQHEHLVQLRRVAWRLIKIIPDLIVVRIPRARNTNADRLANYYASQSLTAYPGSTGTHWCRHCCCDGPLLRGRATSGELLPEHSVAGQLRRALAKELQNNDSSFQEVKVHGACLPKEQVVTAPARLRLITLLPVLWNSVAAGLLSAYEATTSNLSEWQFAYAQNMSVAMLVWVILMLLGKAREWRLPFVLLSTDIVKAFDRINHENLLHCLLQSRSPGCARVMAYPQPSQLQGGGYCWWTEGAYLQLREGGAPGLQNATAFHSCFTQGD